MNQFQTVHVEDWNGIERLIQSTQGSNSVTWAFSYSIIQQEEKRRQISTDLFIPDSMALATRETFSDLVKQKWTTQRKYIFIFCKVPGHLRERCFKANPNKPISSHCHMPVHSVDKCFKIHGYPPGHKLHRKESSSSHLVSLQGMLAVAIRQHSWKSSMYNF